MKAAIALQCSTGNCVYEDAAPPPTPSTHQGFWTGEMVTLLGMALLLFVVFLGAFPAAQRDLRARLNFAHPQRRVFFCTTMRCPAPSMTRRMEASPIRTRCVRVAHLPLCAA